jgi:hypothetical protein
MGEVKYPNNIVRKDVCFRQCCIMPTRWGLTCIQLQISKNRKSMMTDCPNNKRCKPDCCRSHCTFLPSLWACFGGAFLLQGIQGTNIQGYDIVPYKLTPNNLNKQRILFLLGAVHQPGKFCSTTASSTSLAANLCTMLTRSSAVVVE